jgi:hypothetical protein
MVKGKSDFQKIVIVREAGKPISQDIGFLPFEVRSPSNLLRASATRFSPSK